MGCGRGRGSETARIGRLRRCGARKMWVGKESERERGEEALVPGLSRVAWTMTIVAHDDSIGLRAQRKCVA
ncbi:unnamed protein product [Coccothraustes coccothraustes]